VLNLTAQRSWAERRVVLRNRDLSIREDGPAVTTTVRDPDHLLELLETWFSLAFPAGTRFRRPEF
jgi:arylamine N-acetyltransferase